MTWLVGIAGKAGSGKSTAAQVLMDAGWKRIKFADPLKNMLRALGLSEDHIEGDLKTVPCDMLGGRTPRHAMQTLGTEWGRNLIAPTLWIDAARSDIKAALSAGHRVVVDDLRFDNEADTIRALGGVVLGLERAGVGAGGHCSEAGVTADMVYYNDASEAHLRGYMQYVFLPRGGFHEADV